MNTNSKINQEETTRGEIIVTLEEINVTIEIMVTREMIIQTIEVLGMIDIGMIGMIGMIDMIGMTGMIGMIEMIETEIPIPKEGITEIEISTIETITNPMKETTINLMIEILTGEITDKIADKKEIENQDIKRGDKKTEKKDNQSDGRKSHKLVLEKIDSTSLLRCFLLKKLKEKNLC